MLSVKLSENTVCELVRNAICCAVCELIGNAVFGSLCEPMENAVCYAVKAEFLRP